MFGLRKTWIRVKGCIEHAYHVTHDKEYSKIVGLSKFLDSSVDVLGMKSMVPQTECPSEHHHICSKEEIYLRNNIHVVRPT